MYEYLCWCEFGYNKVSCLDSKAKVLQKVVFLYKICKEWTNGECIEYQILKIAIRPNFDKKFNKLN